MPPHASTPARSSVDKDADRVAAMWLDHEQMGGPTLGHQLCCELIVASAATVTTPVFATSRAVSLSMFAPVAVARSRHPRVPARAGRLALRASLGVSLRSAANYGDVMGCLADALRFLIDKTDRMPELLAGPPTQTTPKMPPAVPGSIADELLEREVATFMTPGCVTISEDATVKHAAEALALHRVHAVLVVGAKNGTPLGWVTARGLLDWLGRDRRLHSARDAITEQVTAIHPSARVRAAVYALSLPGTTRLLVRRKQHQSPEGVITDFDLAVAARR
jgi:CBS domain-containing protein